jgi:hypothetical protein
MNLQQVTDKFVSSPTYLDKGAGYLSTIFKTSKKNIYKAKEQARKILNEREVSKLHKTIKDQEDLINRKFNSKGECDLDGFITKRVTTLEDLIEVCKIDTKVWEVVSWECNKWEVGAKNSQNKIEVTPLFQVKAKLAKPKGSTIFGKEFVEFLKTYKPEGVYVGTHVNYYIDKPKAILILPKQDAHFNRVDVYGRNDIKNRFKIVKDATIEIITEASYLNTIEKVTYIVGSDQFNSEWTNTTTGGTPQQNLISYQEAFKLICDHEIEIIENLRTHSKNVEILFVPGNHDEYAGWHLVQWLSCFYRNVSGVTINEGTTNITRRYERFGDSAIMYDHGAICDGKELAQIFPVEFRKEWGKCNHYYIFAGDKHHEKSLDIKSIKYYRVPALTPTKSKWEALRHITPGEMQAFLIREDKGLTNMYSRLLE